MKYFSELGSFLRAIDSERVAYGLKSLGFLKIIVGLSLAALVIWLAYCQSLPFLKSRPEPLPAKDPTQKDIRETLLYHISQDYYQCQLERNQCRSQFASSDRRYREDLITLKKKAESLQDRLQSQSLKYQRLQQAYQSEKQKQQRLIETTKAQLETLKERSS